MYMTFSVTDVYQVITILANVEISAINSSYWCVKRHYSRNEHWIPKLTR